MVVDYGNLNQVTIGDSFQLSLITDLLVSLGHARFFSILDCVMAYYEISVNPDYQPKTAFSTPKGHLSTKNVSAAQGFASDIS